MELTRRDALIALTSIGAVSGLSACIDQLDDEEIDSDVLSSMQMVARTIYPSSVTGIDSFVEAFLGGRTHREEHISNLTSTVNELNEAAINWHGAPIPELTHDEIDSLLREIGSDTAEENPGGTTAERVRFYVVNDLLLALYSSPVGGRLVGIENPVGHPGGTDSYKRGFMDQ